VFAEPTGAQDRIDEIIVAGEVTTERETRQKLGFFATPPALARELVHAAEVGPGDVCLEPSAGDGALVRPILACNATVLCIERDEARRKALLELARDPKCVVDAFVDDFMAFPHAGAAENLPQVFDRVVMNPPFVKVGIGDHIDHVLHAFEQLAPGGTLATILPISVTFRRDTRHTLFRTWYANGRHELTVLPEDAFASSGTRVKTVMLKVQK
jgi:predicted RNA methylase